MERTKQEMQLKRYEAMFIFLDSAKEDGRQPVLDRIGDEIGKLGGSIASTREIGRRPFARTMKKRDHGYYLVMTLDLEPGSITPLLARFKLMDEIFRVQIVHDEPVVERDAGDEGRADKEAAAAREPAGAKA